MTTLPALSTLNEACHDVSQPRPNMPGVERPSIDVTNVRSIDRERVPGVLSEASTADVRRWAREFGVGLRNQE